MIHSESLDIVEKIRKARPDLHPENLDVITVKGFDGCSYIGQYHCLTIAEIILFGRVTENGYRTKSMIRISLRDVDHFRLAGEEEKRLFQK